MPHRVLLRVGAAAIVLLVAGCADYGSTREPADEPTPSASAASTAPSPTSDPAEEAADDDDADDAEDRPAASGDCAAYVDSDGWCTDGIGDYDCEGGSGNGPNYAPADITVVEPGTDPFGLDRDNDGVGCQSPAADPEPEPEPATDPRFGTCGEAIAAGYGPYYQGSDPEYGWYRDADSDGVVCE